MLKHFEPITVDQLIHHIQNREPVKKNSFLLTFDDGLRELKDLIAPILLQKGIQAIFFVNTAFVDNNDLFYRYKASLIIEQLADLSPKNLEETCQILNIRSQDKELIKSAILKINYLNKHVLDDMANKLHFSFDQYLKAKKPYLSLDDLKDLQQKGFAIGAHSVDHPEFFNLALDAQLNQTIESVTWVKKRINPMYNLFAFPFTDYGISKTFFDSVFGNSELNLDLSFGCAGIKDDYHPNHLQRLPVEENKGSASYIIRKEYFAYLLKKAIGKSRIERK
jgi:peptidoglycan/xylan/chitin deacetylase (PgdA/CDA1 family)